MLTFLANVVGKYAPSVSPKPPVHGDTAFTGAGDIVVTLMGVLAVFGAIALGVGLVKLYQHFRNRFVWPMSSERGNVLVTVLVVIAILVLLGIVFGTCGDGNLGS